MEIHCPFAYVFLHSFGDHLSEMIMELDLQLVYLMEFSCILGPRELIAHRSAGASVCDVP